MAVNHVLAAMDACCSGFVLLPDHVHALLWLPQPQDLPRFLHGWKRMSSFRIRQSSAGRGEEKRRPRPTC
jgi:putative transposase